MKKITVTQLLRPEVREAFLEYYARQPFDCLFRDDGGVHMRVDLFASPFGDLPPLVDYHPQALGEPRRISFYRCPTGWRLFDEDRQTITELPCTAMPGDMLWPCQTTAVEELAEYQEVRRPADSLEGGELLGWAYRLTREPEAPWGWISFDFRQCLPPCFNGWCFARDPGDQDDRPFLLYRREEGTCAPLLLMVENCPEEREDPGILHGCWMNICRETPTEDSLFEQNCDFDMLYQARPEGIIQIVPAEENASRVTHARGYRPAHGCLRSLTDGSYHMVETPILFELLDLYRSEGYEDAVALTTERDEKGLRYYAGRKDGWWALFSKKRLFDERQLTPFAFTGFEDSSWAAREAVTVLEGVPYCRVERFGKRGLLDLHSGRYVLPCDYDDIRFDGTAFRLRRSGVDSRWLPGEEA